MFWCFTWTLRQHLWPRQHW